MSNQDVAAWGGFIAVILNGAALFILAWTGWATSRGAGAAKDSAQAALRAAEATERSADVAIQAAESSARSANETQRAAQGALALELLREYSSDETRNSVFALLAYRRNIGNDEHCLMNFADHRLDEKQPAFGIDAHRRRIVHFFTNIYRLYEGEMLDDGVLQTVISSDQVELFLDLEPYDAAIRQEYATGAWEFYARRYKLVSHRENVLEQWDLPIRRAREVLEKKRGQT